MRPPGAIVVLALFAGSLLAQAPVLTGPPAAAIGSPIHYALALSPLTPYVLDVSVSGTFPGITLNPGNVHIPLNPPYLNLDLGALVPGVFVGFNGVSDAQGAATATVNLPNAPAIVGLALSASFIAIDPMAPSSIGGVAMPVTTAITSVAPLVLNQVSPLTAAPGATITISGSGIQAGAIVSVGGTIATILSLSATTITFANPPGQECDTVVSVLNPDGQSATLPFSPAPMISGLVNGSGPAAGGTSLGILGAHFLAGTTVTIGGANAAITFQTETMLFCTTPPGMPGTAQIAVASASGCVALSTFNYQ